MEKEIVSRDNRIFKETRKLAQKKYRDETSSYIVEGITLVKEALLFKNMIKYLVIQESKKDELFKEIDFKKYDLYVMKDSLFIKVAQTATSQGVLAVLSKKEGTNLPEEGNLLIIDRLQDPGNMGTLIRTAEATGYKGVVIMKGSADVFSLKVQRASSGSLFRVPVIFYEDEKELVKDIKESGRSVVVTDLKEGKAVSELYLKMPIALVIGNEGKGVSAYFLDNSDYKVVIPMKGEVESLNAAVAGSILMYETAR